MWMNTEIVALDTTKWTYYSAWFPKGADNGAFVMQLIQDTVSHDGTFVVTVWTKNREDEGSAPGAAVATFTSLTVSPPGYFEAVAAALKELVRFRIAIQAGAVGQGVVLRFLTPTWYDTAV